MLIIAEVGINHNGNINLAKDLIDASIDAGADIVKFQTFWGIDKLKKYELKVDQWIDLIDYCKDMDIEFLSTPHTLEAIDFLEPYIKRYKVASPFLINRKFLELVASKNKPILMSTGSLEHKDGMATIEEIKQAIDWIPKANITLLHCVSKYPCTDANLDRLIELQILEKPIGLSDHTKSLDIPIRLPVIEKHLMLADTECPDSSVSLTPKEFKIMVDRLRTYD